MNPANLMRSTRLRLAWRRFAPAAVLLLITVFVAGEALAQVSTGRSRLRGRITDPDGNGVPGATITLTHTPTGDVVTTEGDDNGVWVKGNMGPGLWRVDIVAPGFQDSVQNMQVRNTGRDTRMETVMQPGSSGGGAGGGDTALTSLFDGELGEAITAANALFDAGDFAGAQAAYQAALDAEMAKENPNREVHYLHLNIGNAAFEASDYTAAAEHYKALLAVVPDNQDARLGVAKSYMMERRIEEAMAELGQIDLNAISDPIVFYNIGSLLFDQGQSAEAAGYYERAIGLDPAFADAYMQLSLSLIQQGKMADAKPHLEKVVELAPDSENAGLAQQFLAMIEG